MLAALTMLRYRQQDLTGRSRGVGLVELLVGVAILGVLLAIAVPSLMGFMERQRIVAVAGEVNGIIGYAKSETNVIGFRVNVHMEDDPNQQISCIAVATHAVISGCKCYNPPSQICTAGAGGARLLRLFQLPKADGVEFAATPWGSGPKVFTFNRANRVQAQNNVQILVKGSRTGAALRIDINQAGRTTICSKVGRLGGYPTCA